MEALEAEQLRVRTMLHGDDAERPGLVARVIALEQGRLLVWVLGGNILVTLANVLVEFWK